MKIATVKDLHEMLTEALANGHGDSPVYVDVEAREFNYHYMKIGDAYMEENHGFFSAVTDGKVLILHEERDESDKQV